MDPAVAQVLEQRERLARPGWAVVSLLAAILIHVALAAVLVLLPRLANRPAPFEYVPVQVVPAQRLGSQSPPTPAPAAPQRTRPREPRAAPPPPAPAKPARPEKPQPAPQLKHLDPALRPQPLPPPREVLAKRLGPAAASTPPKEPPVAPGAAKGSAAGKVAVGAMALNPENLDFTYNYYIAQVQSRIEENWTRPPVGSGARVRVSFRIHADGSISDLAVAESSGFDTYDLAALRAVQNAAPFAPLPRAYTVSHDSVAVNWIAR